MVVLMIVIVTQVISMPNMAYRGDVTAVRAEALELLDTGKLGISYDLKPKLGIAGTMNRGQYYYENDAKKRFFSKYGILYTLLYLPPLYFDKSRVDQTNFFTVTDSLQFYLNVYNILLTLLIALYLYRIISFYTSNLFAKASFLLISFYTTFLWHYLRAPGLDIFQIVGFTAFIYHSLRFLRAGDAVRSGTRGPWWHLLAAITFACSLLLMKTFFAILFIVLYLFAFSVDSHQRIFYLQIYNNLRHWWRRYTLFLVLPSLLAIAIFLSVNDYKFGSPFNTGYGQWLNSQGLKQDRFALTLFPDGFSGFMLKTGNSNLWIHYPLMIFALIGLPNFIRRCRLDAGFIYFIVLIHFLTFCCFSSFSGEWCYGPRYLINILLIASIPIVDTWTIIWHWASRIARFLSLGFISAVLLWSLQMQINMNSLEYFTWYFVSGLYEQFKNPQIDRYFKKTHRGLIHGDLIAWRNSKRPFYPTIVVMQLLPPNQKGVLQEIEGNLLEMTKPNYYFFDK